MCVELNQTKNGVSASCCRVMKSTAASRNSSSTVSIRFLVSGPVSSMRWVPSALAQVCRTPRGPNFLRNSGKSLRIVRLLGLLLGVEVVQVAEELVEAVHGGQVFIAVAEMVLAELPGGVALRLERRRDRRVGRLQAQVGTRQANLGQAGAVRVLAGDERRTPGGATLLPVVVGEQRPFRRDPVDVGRPVPHHAVAVTLQVGLPDIVAPDDQDVRFVTHSRTSRRAQPPTACSRARPDPSACLGRPH